MFSHIMVGSNDVERSKRFYDALFGKDGAPGRQGAPRLSQQGRGVHGHQADRRQAKPATPTAARSASTSTAPKKSMRGTAAESKPAARRSRIRLAYREGGFGKLYLAYLRDPDGNKLCGLHRPPQ